ncbi:LPS export ABC transporter periplasmic protein LptC [Marinomonas transparens]|uniref:LPS export ABC transporter periplasmic protein LptC n=1 Tax=Marinomonas transparens TaxID=2795388 RepID=A0A934MZM9_9GAMM|nr:LPS export ABC transporter periplasmic protein LptC [Marinomonas transparens]MBJ7537715.1 LPS export ABC transporter periplasmic protein LptC [Marinomonas transparens]
MPHLVKLINIKSTSLIAALGVLAAFLLWYGVSPPQNLVQTESLSSSPDYFITRVEVKGFDENGLLIETLDAEKTLHYIKEKRTLLDRPHIKRNSISGSWNAKADKGLIEDGSRDILLTDNVTASKTYLTSPDITLSSDNMHYLDSTKSLTSYGSAKLFSTQGWTIANTITTYIDSEKTVMTGSVRGQYETTN